MTTNNRLQVLELHRFPRGSSGTDSLRLQPGVNVLVGPPNTGKSQWLRTLDLLLGSDKRPEELLAEEVFESYDFAEALVSIGGEEFQLARRWKEPGVKTKIFVDDEPMTLDDFSHFLYGRLGIPLVHYPQGNPYGPRTWPELSWRSILRHMYRRQRFWTDIADKQFESEQHACILQFLGLAERLFSAQYGQLVQTEKEIQSLRMRREDFLRMLEEVSQDVVEEEDLGVALTKESLDELVAKIEQELGELEKAHEEQLRALSDEAAEDAGVDRSLVGELADKLVAEQAGYEEISAALTNVSRRLGQIEEYRQLLGGERQRMSRASDAVAELSRIQISHCPACDRRLDRSNRTDQHSCFLCARPWQTEERDSERARRRVELERNHLLAELKEAEALIASLSGERKELMERAERALDRISNLELRLKPIRRAAAAVLPPEVELSSIAMGRLQQRLLQIQRMRSSLAKRESLSDEISRLTSSLDSLERMVHGQRAGIDFTTAAEALTEGMNSYLNKVHATRASLWAQKPVSLLLDEHGFRFLVGDRSWHSKLGGTATLFFLIAYHYGLLSLTGSEGRNYPGFLILDFPAELDDGTSVGDKENFVLEPFVALSGRQEVRPIQVVAAGSAFEGLQNVNRVEFKRIWR